MIINFINKKLIRLKNSSKVLKLFYYYHYLFNDKKHGNIGFDFTTKKSSSFYTNIHPSSTGSPLIVRFLGPRKNRTNGNPYY